jgi:hypothetical protein
LFQEPWILESESESESSLVSCVSTICAGESPAGCDDVADCAGPSCEDAPEWDEPLACGIEADTACDDVTAIDEALPCDAGGLLFVLCFRFLATSLCGFKL